MAGKTSTIVENIHPSRFPTCYLRFLSRTVLEERSIVSQHAASKAARNSVDIVRLINSKFPFFTQESSRFVRSPFDLPRFDRSIDRAARQAPSCERRRIKSLVRLRASLGLVRARAICSEQIDCAFLRPFLLPAFAANTISTWQ